MQAETSTEKRGKPHLKKILLALLSLLFITAFAFALFLYFFARSPSFPRFIEKTLTNMLKKEVTIGSVTLTEKRIILIENLVVWERGKSQPLFTLPHSEVIVSLSGLLGGRIDSARVREPKLVIKTHEGKTPAKKRPGKTPGLPLKRGAIEGGEVVYLTEKGEAFRIQGIDLHLKETKRGRKATVQGKAFIPLLNAPLYLDAEIDTGKLNVDSGSIDMGSIKLEGFSAAGHQPSGWGTMSGLLSLKADLSRKGKEVNLKLTGMFKDLIVEAGGKGIAPIRIGSGDYRASLKAVDHSSLRCDAEIIPTDTATSRGVFSRAVLAAEYDFGTGELKVEKAAFSSDTLGSLAAEGIIKNVTTGDASFVIVLSAGNISLPELHRYFSPAGVPEEILKYRCTVNGQARLFGSPSETLSWVSDLTLTNLLISSKNLVMDLGEKPVKVSSTGSYEANKDLVKLTNLRTSSSVLGSWLLRGTLSIPPSGSPEADLTLEGEKLDLGGVMSTLSGTALSWADGTNVKGTGEGSFTIGGTISSPAIKGSLRVMGKSLKGHIAQAGPFEAALPVELTGGRFTVREGFLMGKSAAAAVSRENGTLLSLAGWNLAVPLLVFRGNVVRSEGLALRAESAVIKIGEREVAAEKGVTIAGTLDGNREGKKISLENFSLSAGATELLSGNLVLDFGDDKTISASVKGGDIDLATVKARFPRFLPALQGINVKGKLTVQTDVSAKLTGGSPDSATGVFRLKLEGGGFSSEDGQTIGEGILMNASLRYVLFLSDNRVAFTANANAGGFELLSGRFYGDFTGKSVTLALDGEYRIEEDVLSLSRAALNLPGTGTLSLAGRVAGLVTAPRVEAEVRIENLANSEAFSLFIRETYKESFPLLSRIDVGGSTGLYLRVKGSRDTFTAEGDLRVTDGKVKNRNGKWSAEGIQITLPVHLTYPGLSLYGSGPRPGSVTIGHLSWLEQDIDGLAFTPVFSENALAFENNITVPLFGGSIILKDISYKDFLNPKRKLHLSIDLVSLDLSQLSDALEMPVFRGGMSGTIPEVRLSGSSLVTEGEVVMNLFGGEMRVKEISISDVFSPVAALKSTIEIREIDLGRLTDKFDFGHISGVLQGYVRDLVVTRGQPESFEAQLETVKRRGISQKISVEALEKITIIGTGSSATVLGRGIYSLFQKYRYRKIGFSASLKNDIFVLIGIEREGNKGYLVRGSILPPKVNVINYTQAISFGEMMKRLKQVDWKGKGKGAGGE